MKILKTNPQVSKLVDSYGNWVCQKGLDNCEGGTAKLTNKLYPYDSIFSPIKVNSITIKNRIVMGPMGNLMMSEETGRPSDKMLEYFFARAKGGVGLITTGLIPVSHGIDHTVTEVNKLSMFPRIDGARTNFMGWRDLAQGVHNYGSKIFIQLTAGLGRVGAPTCLVAKKQFPKSASINPNFYIPELPCLRISDHQLTKIIKNIGQASADAKECGLDGVYLHGHEGYLIEQMTNPAFNRRLIGKYADYQRFGIDMIKEIRKRVGPRYPIMYRIDLSLALNETYGKEGMNSIKSLKKFKNGRTIEETLEYMKNLVKAGVDMFDVDLGCYDNWWLPHPPAGMPAGCFLDISKIAKDYFKENNILSNAGLPVPVVAVGKLGYPDVAEKALRDNKCDMVMLARPLLSDPDWCNKTYVGDTAHIIPCIGCQEGCVNEFVLGGHPQCAVNPRTGFEDTKPEDIPLAKVKKSICVVGAGPAGIVFAVNCLKRGHKVTLVEKSNKVGGKVICGSAPKIKFDFENYLRYLEQLIADEKNNKSFTLLLNKTVDKSFFENNKFDSIVYAVGTKPISPKIPGIEKVKTIQGTDLLLNKDFVKDAKKVIVIGGGVVGCETAYWLSYELGKEVSVVEMLPNFMEGVCTANRGHLLHYMNKNNVKLFNASKVVGFEEGKVIISQNISKNVPNPYNTWQPLLPVNIPNPLAKKMKNKTEIKKLDGDVFVLAMGGRADDSLYFEAVKEHYASEIYNIGDSNKAGRVLEATRAALNLALKI